MLYNSSTFLLILREKIEVREEVSKVFPAVLSYPWLMVSPLNVLVGFVF